MVGQWGEINAHPHTGRQNEARTRGGSTIIIHPPHLVPHSHLLVANGVTVPGACPRSPSVPIEHRPIPCHVQLLVEKEFGILRSSIPPHYCVEAGGPG
jgi:hypothetical protein